MIQSSKKKAHYGCSCGQCKAAGGTAFGQMTHNQYERKLRRQAKQELQKAVKDAQRELEDVDIIPSNRTPRIG